MNKWYVREAAFGSEQTPAQSRSECKVKNIMRDLVTSCVFSNFAAPAAAALTPGSKYRAGLAVRNSMTVYANY